MEIFKEKIETMVARGYKIQECVTSVIQYFDINLTQENLECEAPESNNSPETYYNISKNEYVLLDEDENEVISGDMDDIREYIENNL